MITFSFGPPPPDYDPIYTGYLVQEIAAAFANTVSETAPSTAVLLQSPDKTLYALTVDNTGNLKVTKVVRNA